MHFQIIGHHLSRCPTKIALVFASTLLSAINLTQAAEFEDWNARFQATYVWQAKSSFPATYSGPNSLTPDREKSYSFTSTAAFGIRLWDGGEFYFDPEVAQGKPLSNLTGLGGFTNGEIARTSGSTPKIYRARLFLRQTWDLGGEKETLESGFNQLAGTVDSQRLIFTAGNLSILDIFDNNNYSHDPRTQFLNWSIMTHGAYDYAADTRGYSWGLAIEWYDNDWSVRAGRFLQPKEPNQQVLDTSIFRHYGDQVELEHGYTIAGRPGKLRLLAFLNRARMSRFQDALDLAAQTGGTPDINAVRNSDQTKHGFGINLEQTISGNVGSFLRASWADGQTETYAFTEIDRSLSGGVVIKGNGWGRGQDSIGIALARNGLSKARRDYLAAGGMSFFIGDGQLNYHPETIMESFYNLKATKDFWMALDWQYIRNPAYNSDRGPVKVGALRLHTEF